VIKLSIKYYYNEHQERVVGMLSIQNVSKTYSKGKVKAVDKISLEVKPGEIFGFLGPNGAGKTTTIKMITGILPIDEGKITICGYDIEKDAIKAKMSMGFVPDTHDIYDRPWER
jgi:ABC-2 type transport system ATP-binding protein